MAYRGKVADRCRSCHLRRFRDANGDLLATSINVHHIESFIATLRQQRHALDYVQKHCVSVGAMFNKGVKREWLPPFRHLWISEMLMAGVDVLLVARMAGTSVAMIERVYGYFRDQSYQEAQVRLDRVLARRGL